MKQLVTDYKFFHRKHKEFDFFQNEILPWKLVESDYGLIYERKSKRTLGRQKKINYRRVSGVVSPSNYRLIFDMLKSFEESSFYKPHRYFNLSPFKYPYEPNKKEIYETYSKFIVRGFISFLFSLELNQLGFKRIEQFLAILAKVEVSSEKSYFDNQYIAGTNHKELTITKITQIKEKQLSIGKKIDLVRFVSAYSIFNKIPFFDVIKKVESLYYYGGCSDPFDKFGVEFYQPNNKDPFDNSLFEFYSKIASKKNIIISISVVELGSGKKIPIKTAKNILKELNLYLQLQEKSYFVDQILISEDSNVKFLDSFFLIKALNKYMPLKDSILTIQLLVKLNRISFEDSFFGKIKVTEDDIQVFTEHHNWLDYDYWDDIYSSPDYSFDLEPINPNKNKFKCPICNEDNSIVVSPLRVSCKTRKCKFKFLRNNLGSVGVSKVKVEDIYNLFKDGGGLIEKDVGGFLSVFINRVGDTYTFWWEKEDGSKS